MPPRKPRPPLVLGEDTSPYLCRIAGCCEPQRARGLCAGHHNDALSSGRLEDFARPVAPPRRDGTYTSPAQPGPSLTVEFMDGDVEVGPAAGVSPPPRKLDLYDEVAEALGVDADGSDADIVGHVRRVKAERDALLAVLDERAVPGSCWRSALDEESPPAEVLRLYLGHLDRYMALVHQVQDLIRDRAPACRASGLTAQVLELIERAALAESTRQAREPFGVDVAVKVGWATNPVQPPLHRALLAYAARAEDAVLVGIAEALVASGAPS